MHRKGHIRLARPGADRPLKLFLLIFTALALASFAFLDIEWAKLATRLPDTLRVLSNLAHLSTADIGTTLTALMESVAVAALSTFYSIFIGLIFGALMSRNLMPGRIIPGLLSMFFALIRAVPTVVWVLLALVGLGFGPTPGIVGMCLHTIAFFAKVFKQAFEEVSLGSIEALKATGASRAQIFFSAVLPSAMTQIIAWGSLRFETNLRESSILGMVGAGGVGYIITASMSAYNYGRAGAAIVSMLFLTLTVELLLTRVKRSVQA